MAGYLTTHVLDTARGMPAAGLKIALYRIGDGGARVPLGMAVTNDDGRTDGPILPQAEFEPGIYELEFHAGAYLQGVDGTGEPLRFLDVIPIRFGMRDPVHHHVPLLLSPFGYSTYRGS